jgi:hypothetical protein
VEHALAEEGAAKPHAIQSADEFSVPPRFHRMAMPDFMKLAVEVADPSVDPGP